MYPRKGAFGILKSVCTVYDTLKRDEIDDVSAGKISRQFSIKRSNEMRVLLGGDTLLSLIECTTCSYRQRWKYFCHPFIWIYGVLEGFRGWNIFALSLMSREHIRLELCGWDEDYGRIDFGWRLIFWNINWFRTFLVWLIENRRWHDRFNTGWVIDWYIYIC